MRQIFYTLLLICSCFTLHAHGDILKITLSERQLSDVELLLTQGFFPLQGFMGKTEYDRVVKEMRLGS